MRHAFLRAVLIAATATTLLFPAGVRSSDALPQFVDKAPLSDIRYVTNNDFRGRKYFPQPMCGGVAILDYDNDGLMNIFFTNGARLPESKKTEPAFYNTLLRNKGDELFEDVTVQARLTGEHLGFSYGVAAADYDNDSWPDLFIANAGRNTLYRNGADGTFSDVTASSGLAKPPGTPSVNGAWFDYDNDGWKDLYSANGDVDNLLSSSPQHDTMFKNNNGKEFAQASEQMGEDFLRVGYQRGSAFGDLNDDGFMDLVVTSLNEKPRILFNSGRNANHSLMVSLRGRHSNRDGIGASIKLTTGSGRTIYNHVTTSVGFMSSSDKRVHFGLGEEQKIKSLEVRWPSGAVQVVRDLPADQFLALARSSHQWCG